MQIKNFFKIKILCLSVTVLFVAMGTIWWTLTKEKRIALYYKTNFTCDIGTEPRFYGWFEDDFIEITLSFDFNRHITDKELKPVENSQHLYSLGLTGTKITDEGVKIIGSLSSLQILRLADLQISDKGLQELKSLSDLEDLGLSSTRITDKGLLSLYSLSSLREVRLKNTDITLDGVKKLKKALPLCKVHSDFE